jgi:L-cysteine S-thiosulfotransferase
MTAQPALLLAALLAALAPPAMAQGDAERGAAIANDRSLGLCVLCHALPGQNPALQGNIGPPLAGVGSRLDASALRQRLLAPERFNPDTVMPSYGRVAGLQQVAAARRGAPLLSDAQIDDVVAWLGSLR